DLASISALVCAFDGGQIWARSVDRSEETTYGNRRCARWGRLMPLPAGATAINLGCGLSTAPGWINIDNSPNARLAKYPWVRWTLWKIGILSDLHYSVNWSDSIQTYDLKKTLP